jgi:hypothetical protein
MSIEYDFFPCIRRGPVHISEEMALMIECASSRSKTLIESISLHFPRSNPTGCDAGITPSGVVTLITTL